MRRIEITRAEYEEQTGLITDSSTIGAVFYTPEGVPLVEYVFIEEPDQPWSVKSLEKLYKL